jgi:anti-sigma factor RsiW
MEHEAQLKLQAFLDGELPEAEANKVAQWLNQDRDAAALAAELRQTHDALAGFETGVRLPESREFFWSKIERDIRRSEAPRPVSEPAGISFLARLRRFLAPATAVALVVMAGLIVTRQDSSSLSSGAEMETALSDAGAFTYRDFNAGATLVWLSYPAENDLAGDDDIGTVE